MPGFNHKGPMGDGPMTGRKMGKCTNFGAGKNGTSNEIDPNRQNMTGQGRGFGKGMGNGQKGRGFGLKHS